jgi:hypothetical protein
MSMNIARSDASLTSPVFRGVHNAADSHSVSSKTCFLRHSLCSRSSFFGPFQEMEFYFA